MNNEKSGVIIQFFHHLWPIPFLRCEARSKVIEKIRDVFQRFESQPLTRVRDLINPILRDWVQYFKTGNSSKVFGYIEDWLTWKIRRNLMKAKGKQGFGWKQWSIKGLYAVYNIYSDFKVSPGKVVLFRHDRL